MGADEGPRLAGLEGFEVWDRNVQAPTHKKAKTAFVSIRVCGTIGISKTCWTMWGKPEACIVMFDPERRRIALNPATPNSLESLPSSLSALSNAHLQGPSKSVSVDPGLLIPL